jgi:hypothetical protein
MRGSWLIAIASRILREQTFQLIAVPAIADLQFEGGWRHYAAIGWVIVRALLQDLRVDVVSVFGSTARASVWPKTLALFALLFVVMTAIAFGRGIRFLTPEGAVSRLPWPSPGDGLEPLLVGLLVTVALGAAGYATLGLTFALRRGHAPARSILVGTLCLAALAYAAARATRPIAETADIYRSAAIARAVWYPSTEPLATIVAEDVIPSRTAVTARRDIWLQSAVWRERQISLKVLIFALVGVTLARGRGLGILIRAVGILGTADVLRDAMPWLSVMFWTPNSPRPSVTLEQLPAFLILPLLTVAVLTFDVWVTSRRRDSLRAARA